MRVVFLSNYFNHHQRALSDALVQRCEYSFIATEEMSDERRKLGWEVLEVPKYVYFYENAPSMVETLLAQADAVIAGSAPEHLFQACIRRGQLVFRYSERPLKNGLEIIKFVPRLIRWQYRNPRWKPVYLLCASAFAAGDYAKFGLFKNKSFQWGYFPDTIHYNDTSVLLEQKQKNTILWSGRFLEWKHPDDALFVAERLIEEDVPFEMKLIGGGAMEHRLLDIIYQKKLEKHVQMLGVMTPKQVRMHMEQTAIFMVTSDCREGWGAVLNEAMNSGCAVVASDAVGATPYLVRHGQNGFTYHSGDVEELYANVKRLLQEPELAEQMGTEAYNTITEEWNGEVAAERLLQVIRAIKSGDPSPDLFQHGPCSKEDV